MTLPILQLLPPDVSDEALLFLDSVAPRDRRAERRVVRRPVATAIELARGRTGGAGEIYAVGSAILGAVSSKLPVTYIPNVTPRAGELRAAGWMGRRREVRAVGLTDHARRALRRSGVFGKIEAGVIALRGTAARGHRDAFGFAAEDRVVLALGETSRENDHVKALWTVAIARLADRRWKLLVSGGGRAEDALRRFVRDSGIPGLAVFASDFGGDFPGRFTTESLTATADFILATAPGPADAGPLLRVRGAGKPILAISSPQAREFLPRESIAEAPTPRWLAQRLMELDGAELIAPVLASPQDQ
jgi:hypothetical protein